MNKRAIIKVGVTGILITIIVSILLLISTSSAITSKTQYSLDEKVKLDLKEYNNYKLKITTPSTSFIKGGSNDVFIFKTEEIGNYKIEIKFGGEAEIFEFEVIDESIEDNNNNPVNDAISSDNTTHFVPNKTDNQQNDSKDDFQIIIGEPVKQIEKLNVQGGELRHKIPKKSENISVLENGEKIDYEIEEGGFLLSLLYKNKEVVIENPDGKIQIEYYTKGPEKEEKIISEKEKEVTISSDYHYENVLAYTSISEDLKLENENSIKIYWKEEGRYLDFETKDENSNGIIDRIEWIVPHLSEQTFEIIVIKKADRLNENRELIEDIYEKVNERDDIWTTILDGEYIRVVFEELLDKTKDITIYAKSNDNARVEVYEKDGTEKIADFGEISTDGKYQIFLNNLIGLQNTFDLLIKGGTVNFDFIVDPVTEHISIYNFSDTTDNSAYYKETQTNIAIPPAWTDGWDGSEVGAGDYTNLATSNSVPFAFYASGGNGREPFARFDFTIDENVSDINWIQVSMIQREYVSSGGNEHCYYYVADFNSNAWESFGTQMDGNSYVTRTSNLSTISNYINGDQLSILSLGSNQDAAHGDGCGVDYVEVKVGYNVTTNDPPTQGTPILNSSDGTDSTNANLTCYNQSTSDLNGDDVKNIFNWYKDGASLAVLNMPFEGGSNSTWTKDYSGLGNDGIVSGATWDSTGGYDGFGAYDFDGVDNYIQLLDDTEADALGIDFSVSLWFKSESTSGNGGGRLITRDCNSYWCIYAQQNVAYPQNLVFYTENDNSVTLTDIITDSNWHHVAATWNGTDVLIYYDGILNNTQSFTDFTTNSRPIIIGDNTEAAPNPGSSPFDGPIDDVMIFNHSLSAEQIKALYNNRTDLIVSQETALDDIWQACITPNDGEVDGAENCSNDLTVLDEISFGSISIDLIDPDSDKNVVQNQFFNFTVNVTCSNGECGDVNATLDPISYGDISVSISASSDDAEENAAGTTVYTGSSDLEMVYDDYQSAGQQIVGMRFNGVNIPEGATIINASVTFMSDNGDSDDGDPTLLIMGEDSDNPSTFADVANNISGRPLTEAYVSWSPGTWEYGSRTEYSTPDISSVVQEIVDRSGWSSGNSLVIIVNGSSDENRKAEAYDGSTSDSPLLFVNYSTGSADKVGTVPMNSGTPFYTTSQNPMHYINTSCLEDMSNESCLVTWTVNATGDLDSIHEFYAYANSTTYPSLITSDETVHINITITDVITASAGEIQCEQGGSFKSCDEIDFGETLTAVRVDCTYSEGSVTNATFNLTGIADNYNYFYKNATSSSGDWWAYDNTDIIINDSGEFKLSAQCFDEDGGSDSNSTNWTVDWGVLSVTLIDPTSNKNVSQNNFFTFTSRINCVGGECGNVNATLDPMLTYSIFEDFESGSQNVSLWDTYQSGGDARIQWDYDGTGGPSPYQGSNSLSMDDDDTATGDYSLNVIYTVWDFTGATDIYLSVWTTDNGDENNAASDHSGNQNSEGIFYTCDGTNWDVINNYLPESHADNTWREITINITEDPDFCSEINSNFAIKFSQYDNYRLTNDGIFWDNINITYVKEVNKGVIPMNSGNPFYTTSQNPMDYLNTACLEDMKNENCSVSWSVNVTGELNLTWEFFAYANSTDYPSLVSSTPSSVVNITIVDAVPPTINLIYPVDTTNYSSNRTELNYSVAEGGAALDDCWYILNGGSPVVITCGQNVSGINSIEGSNTWTIYANDTASIEVSDSITFYVDTTSPNATLLSPENETSIVNKTQNMTVNASDDLGITNATLFVYNSSGNLLNMTTVVVTGTQAVVGILYEFLYDGIFNWFYRIYDVSGHYFDTENNTVTVEDVGVLTVDLIDPSSNRNVNPNEFFNFTAQINCNGGQCGDVNATLDPIGWWNSSWAYRKEISISAESTLVDFPVYLNVTKMADMLNNYNDLRFINGSCYSGSTLELDYEIENYTGTKADVWVRIPALVSGTNKICMYYSNPDASNNENAEGVWKKYLGVWHLKELGVGTRYDSTQNNHDGTPINYDGDEAVDAGIVDGADNLATNDYISIVNTDAIKLMTNNFTVSSWTYVSGTSQQMFLYHGLGCSTWASWLLSIGGNENQPAANQYAFGFGTSNAATNNNVYSNGNAITNQWVLLTATYDGSTLSLYVNGELNNTASVSGTPWNSLENFYIGADPGCGLRDPVNGRVDQIFVTNESFSSSRINQSYQMIINQNDIISFGDDEENNKGIISMVVGTKPFYTTNLNPNDYTDTSCLGNMQKDTSCNVTWRVNATGNIGSTWDFFVYANSTNFSSANAESTHINITIGNLPPEIPELDFPINESAFSTFSEFNWSNSTDPTGDSVYYIFEISNTSDFSIINYGNYSIPETEEPTGDTPTGITTDGLYYWRVLATDLKDNSSWSEVRIFYYDTTAPNVTIVAPPNETTNTTTNTVSFYFNVTDSTNVTSCSLIIDGAINQTKPSITKGATQTIETNLANGIYFWNINCTDQLGQIGTSEIFQINMSVADNPPKAHEIECNESGTWKSCSEVGFGETLTEVRVRCTDPESGMTNATLILKNDPDNYTFFTNTTIVSSGDYWIFDNTDIIIEDSGNFTISAKCTDSEGFTNINSTTWLVPWGTLNIDLINPSSNINVLQNAFFNFTSQINCLNGECGNINATLDPAGAWWDNSWLKRKTINITSASALTNFPAYLNLSYDPDMLSNLDDIRFINGSCESGDTLILPYEIEDYSASKADLWVNIPNLVVGTTSICLYYGNPDASSGENASGVWDENYTMVLHMDNATSTSILDSTQQNNGTKRSTTQPAQTLGKIGLAQSFAGDGYVDIPLTWSGGPVTFEFWAYIANSDLSQQNNLFASNVDRMNSHTPWSGSAYFDYGPGCCGTRISTSYASYTDKWTHVTYTSEASTGTNRMDIYFDGISVINNALGGEVSGITDFKIGSNSAGTGAFTIGSVDEFRISKIVRSAEWINQSYQMSNNPSDFTSYGLEEQGKGGAISMVAGTLPFYTVDQNPMHYVNTSCLEEMRPQDSCNVTWSVNATGATGTTWEFFVYGNTTNYTNWFNESSTSSTINITIVTEIAPTVPQLNAPSNASAFASIPKLNWTNSTDANGDTIYYVLEVSNVSDFSSTVYTNGSIAEQAGPTGDTPTEITEEGTYYWRVLATDLGLNSSWSETWIFYYDLSAPNITFINQTGEDELIINDSNPLEQGEDLTIYVNVSDTNADKVWIIVWDTVKGGAEKVKVFFTYLGGILWKAVIPTDATWNLLSYNYTIYANDSLGDETEYNGNFSMIHGNITLSLDPNPVTEITNVTAYGHLNLSDGTDLANHPINIWLNGTLLLLSNVTPEGTYDNYQEFNDTTNTQFNKGTYYQTTTDGENITLVSGNSSGNYTRILDAGARVEWDNITWSWSGESCSGITTFQEGDSNNYSSTHDSYISSSFTSSNYGSNTNFVVDGSPVERGLIKFENIIGRENNQIPENSTINDAKIELNIYDLGNMVTVYQILENWTESQTTYTNRLTGTAWTSTGCAGSPSRSTISEDTFTADPVGSYSFDIDEVFKKWVNGSSSNYGVVLDMVTSNGINVRSSEYTTQSERPKLTVNYTASECTNIIVYYRTSNDKITWTNWQQISNGGTISDSNIASRYLEYKAEMTATNTTLTPSLNEIIVNYTAIVTDASGDYSYNFTNPSQYGTYLVIVNTSLRTIDMSASENLSVSVGVPPEINLSAPSDGQWFSTGALNLEYDLFDANDDLANSTLIINGAANATNTSALAIGEVNTFSVDFPSGQYNWSVNVTDSQNNEVNSSTWTFYIDLINPIVNLIYPDNTNTYTVNELNLSFNATDNMDSNLICDVVLDGSTIAIDEPAGNGSTINVSSGTLSNGLHYWNVTCTDEANRTNTSVTWSFNISDTPPTVILIWPTDTYLNDDGNISFIFNATDNTGFTNCSLIINESEYTINQTAINNGGNTTINKTGLAEGDYNWTVICYDLSNSTDQPTEWDFSVDLYSPTIDLNLPGDTSDVSTSDVNFNFTVNDTYDSDISCNLTINGIIEDTFSATSELLTNRPINGLIDGVKNWNVTCVDDAGHSNVSATWSVNVSEAPTVELNIDNETSYNVTSINLTYTPTDNTNLSSCSLYLEGSFNQSNSSEVINGQQNNFSLNGLNDGTYSWYVNCSDYIGLSGTSETRVFYIDGGAPNVTLHYPNNIELGLENITFNFTVTDKIDSSFNCSLTVDSTIENSSINAQNGSVTNATVSGISDGDHIWFVNCTDSANNIGSSEVFNFTRSTPPLVLLISPNDTHWFNTSTFNLTYFAFDDEGFLSSTLYINNLANQTNTTTILNNNNNNFSISNFPDGIYNWTIQATDIRGLNTTASPNRSFYIDTKIPEVILNAPNGSAIIATNNVTFNFTTSDNLDSNINCNLSLDGEIEYSDVSSNGSDVINYIIVSDGNHTWNTVCWDGANNMNYSESINFTVIAPPTVNLTFPSSGNRTNLNDITFYYIPNDPIGFNKCDFYLDDMLNDTDNNPEKNEENNFTINGIPEGNHNWTVNCTDSDDNTAKPTARSFTIDQSPPNITLGVPADEDSLVYDGGSIIFNWTTTDDYASFSICDLVIDGVVEEDDVLVTNGIQNPESVPGLGVGTHYWNVTCWDSDIPSNSNTSETRSFNISEVDFKVNTTSITFNKSQPAEDETVLVNATIYNLGGADAEDVVVRFYDGDPDLGGVQIGGDQTDDISKYNETIFSVVWTADIGPSEIFVVVDPPLATNGSFEESNESNNKASKNISVIGWHFFYGNINADSEFKLADSSDYKIIQWNQGNLTNANIYVTDYDSIIEWTKLQAIGKNVSGLNTSNDITEIDTMLSMTTFQDSLSSLYLNGGEINETQNFIIFSKAITGVPVTTSINSSNFKTGILWDMDDDTNQEFDSAEKEDLIFVTKVNKDTAGSYGITDYEMRVPAKLREYDATDSSIAVFYIEIN